MANKKTPKKSPNKKSPQKFPQKIKVVKNSNSNKYAPVPKIIDDNIIKAIKKKVDQAKKKKNVDSNEQNKEIQQLFNEIDRQEEEYRKKKGLSKNEWINFVKRYAKQHKISYACAVSMPEVKKLWEKRKLKLEAKKLKLGILD